MLLATRSRHDCSHRPPCPGCPRFGEAGIAVEARVVLERLARDTGAELLPAADAEPMGHRHRARLMVRGRAASPKVGMFQAGSHRIVDTPSCRVHHPRINEVAAALKRAMRATRADPYADAPHRGLVRALQVVIERSSQRAQVVLVTRDESPDSAEALIAAFTSELEADGLLHSLWWNGNPERTNTILGPHWERRSGPGAVVETIGGARVFFPPAAFGQSHLVLADRLVADVHALSRDASSVAEWYAGCGAFGLGMLARGADVRFNEQSPAGLAGLELGISAAGVAAGRRSQIAAGPAGAHVQLASGCDFALVDPPRRGLDPELLGHLAGSPPRRLAYVSCGLASFERDARVLLESGRSKLVRLAPYALFPFTNHVEMLAVFEADR